MEEQKNWCDKCESREHCLHTTCGSRTMFTELYCTQYRADLHLKTMKEEAIQGYGHKFAPTGLTYFTTPTTYQYIHLNSSIQFRSEEINAEKAGAYW